MRAALLAKEMDAPRVRAGVEARSQGPHAIQRGQRGHFYSRRVREVILTIRAGSSGIGGVNGKVHPISVR